MRADGKSLYEAPGLGSAGGVEPPMMENFAATGLTSLRAPYGRTGLDGAWATAAAAAAAGRTGPRPSDTLQHGTDANANWTLVPSAIRRGLSSAAIPSRLGDRAAHPHDPAVAGGGPRSTCRIEILPAAGAAAVGFHPNFALRAARFVRIEPGRFDLR